MTSTLSPAMAEATLDLAPEAAREAFQKIAALWDCPTQIKGERLRLSFPRGAIDLHTEGGNMRVLLRGDEPSYMQGLRDSLSDQLALASIRLDWAQGRSGQRPANLSVARVLSVRRISPSFTRVEIEGDDLARFASGGLHFRLLFGPEGAGWPETDAQGLTRWPDGAGAWHRPVYTTREITTSGRAARLTFDIFRHEGGRVTQWADAVATGAEIALTGPGGGETDLTAPWQGFVGDETALPVIARLLSALPDTAKGDAVIFVPDPADIQPIAHPQGVNLRWAMRGGEETPLSALAALPAPAQGRHIFFAGEKSEALAARTALLDRGLQRREFTAATYWIRH